MRQPDAAARGFEASGLPCPRSGQAKWTSEPPEPTESAEPAGAGGQERSRLPPGQHVQAAMPVLHYGPVPGFDPLTWDLQVYGATASGEDHRWDWDGFWSLPRSEIIADFHCVTKFTILGITWSGVSAAEVLSAVPPAAAVTHVMVWANFGYGANLPLDAFAAPDTMLATHRDGRELSPEQGFPVRLVVPSRYGWKSVKWVRAIEYMADDRRGFWEERGYHNNADPWQEQRYSYQEQLPPGSSYQEAPTRSRVRVPSCDVG